MQITESVIPHINTVPNRVGDLPNRVDNLPRLWFPFIIYILIQAYRPQRICC